jgi:uncharacterized protein YdbL (DUF1318 family)
MLRMEAFNVNFRREEMFANILKLFVAVFCGLIAACAVITVNVYFPEKDVKQAYKSLDEMLIKQGGDDKKPAGEPPHGTEEKKLPEEIKPQSRLNDTRFDFPIVAVAYAAENIADDLAVEMSSMPDVLKAYDNIKASIPKLNALRDSGAVGENKQGLISIMDKGKLGDNEAFVKSVNEDRKVVITGMARAILKVNKQTESKDAMNQVLGKAAAMFADVRHEEAKPAWWIELPNGRWVQK